MSGESKKHQFGKWVEWQARILRDKAEVQAFDRLNPLLLAQKMQIRVESLSNFDKLPLDLIEPVLGIHGNCWDAGTLQFPDSQVLVIYNPNRDDRRRNATLMEELAHIHLGHKPTVLMEFGDVVLRSLNRTAETQAYAVGAAALLPAYLLKGARTRGYSKLTVANLHQVSDDLVTYREQVTGIRLENAHNGASANGTSH